MIQQLLIQVRVLEQEQELALVQVLVLVKVKVVNKVEKVKAASDKLKETIKGGDTDAIKKATEELQKPLYELSAAAYQAAGAQAQGAPGAGAEAGPQPGADQGSSKPEDDNVVDAEYTEVKDDKK